MRKGRKWRKGEGGSSCISDDSLVGFEGFFFVFLISAEHVKSCYSTFQSAARVIKETMDKRYGATWHCVVGEAFGFEVSYEVKNLLYMFFAGNLAIAVWKCC